MKRTNRLSRMGYTVQQIAPSRLERDPASVVAELRAAYDAGLARRQLAASSRQETNLA